MPETYSTPDKPIQEQFLLTNSNANLGCWDDAITLAKERLESIKAVIEVFERYRDTGEPFPGESEQVAA